LWRFVRNKPKPGEDIDRRPVGLFAAPELSRRSAVLVGLFILCPGGGCPFLVDGYRPCGCHRLFVFISIPMMEKRSLSRKTRLRRINKENSGFFAPVAEALKSLCLFLADQ